MVQAFRSQCVMLPDRSGPATIVVEGEKIVRVSGWDEVPDGAVVRDFGRHCLLPGLVDTHVHINEPGRSDWEGFRTATRAAAAGGVTTLVDMPLNCVPETTNVEALEAKRSAARGKAWVDWAAWGGVVHGNADSLPDLVRAGVPGFKCFMIHSGIDGFAWVDESDLRVALERLKGVDVPLLVHAEAAGPVNAATESLNAAHAGWRSYSIYLASRPDEAELDAIALLIRLADECNAHIHIVHLSSARALPLLDAARRRGVRLSVETCLHYLQFASEEIPDGATEFKCAPPIRDAANREALWAALEQGLIDMVTTDHSPCPPAMKRREEGRFDQAWGGVSSLGLALPVVWMAMHRRGIGIDRIAEWMAAAPARLAGFQGHKGQLAAGADADLAVFDPEAAWTVTPEDLHFRHKLSPYLGGELRGRVLETWLRGRQIFAGNEFIGEPGGREQVRQ